MKNNTFRLLIVAFIFIFTIGCPDKAATDYSVSYINNSETEDIFVSLVFFVDTILPSKEYGVEVKKGGSKKTVNFEAHPSDFVHIYLVSQDTINKYSWEQIRQDYNIIKRYDLSLKDLKKMNWKITYP